MYPPEQRARGIALVLSGAVVARSSARWSSIRCSPGVSCRPAAARSRGSRPSGSRSSVSCWCCASGPIRAGSPSSLAARDAGRPRRVDGGPIREIVRRPGVAPALLGALASFSVMASVMNLIGYVVVAHGNHEPSDVFPIIGAHVFGMYAFVVIVGPFVDRFGRRRPLVGGLVLMGACCAALALVSGVVATAVLLFGLGLGWSFAFLAASSDLVDRTSPRERGRLLGLSDMLSGITAATLAIVGGLVLDRVGVRRWRSGPRCSC